MSARGPRVRTAKGQGGGGGGRGGEAKEVLPESGPPSKPRPEVRRPRKKRHFIGEFLFFPFIFLFFFLLLLLLLFGFQDESSAW